MVTLDMQRPWSMTPLLLLLALSYVISPSLAFMASTSTSSKYSRERRDRTMTSPSMSPFPSPKETSSIPSSLLLSPLSSPSLDWKHLETLTHTPKLMVWDLDNTLWTPELYQIRQKEAPKPGKDIRLFDDAPQILASLRQDFPHVQHAIASRTSKAHWAHQLLEQFVVEDQPLRQYFALVEIYTGSKKQHFQQLQRATGFSYSEMLFVDDDERMNLGEISQLGVLCCHTPRGVTQPHIIQALQHYHQLKVRQEDTPKQWMGYILNRKVLNVDTPEETHSSSEPLQGKVKFYSSTKKFGFIVDTVSRQEYFVHESKIPVGTSLQTGDSVVFTGITDSRGRPAAVVLSAGKDGDSSTPASNAQLDTKSMPCFSMSQPFASLLLYGIKTVESRNSNMFVDLPPGTKVLLHCGRRDWKDQESFRQILMDSGMTAKEIETMRQLPKGFGKGSVAGIVTIGRTWTTTPAERQSPELQRKVLAYEDGIGKICTEIRSVSWLQKPFPTRGSPGIYFVDVPGDYLPEDGQ